MSGTPVTKPLRLAAMHSIKVLYEQSAFERFDLISTDEGYELWLHTRHEVLIVARREGDAPRSWRSVDRALNYVKTHFGDLQSIQLYPTNQH